MKLFYRSISLVMAAALLLCGCKSSDDNDHGGDIDLVGKQTERGEQKTTPATTTAASADKDIVTTTTTTAASTEPEETYSYVFDWAQSVEHIGYEIEIVDLYRVNNATDERELILADITNHITYDDDIIAYLEVDKIELGTGTDAPYIASFNKETGEINTIYTAKSNDMELFNWYYTQSGDLLIKDGDKIRRIDTDTLKATTLFRLSNGMFASYPEQFASLKQRYKLISGNEVESDLERLQRFFPDDDLSDYYICDQCKGSDEFCIWEDQDENWFWYHPHSRDNEPIIVDDERYDRTPDGFVCYCNYVTRAE